MDTARNRQELFDQLTGTLNALPDLLFELDREGIIHTYRAPRTELLYVPPEQFIGQCMFDVLPADAAQVVRDALREAAAAGLHRGGVYSLTIKGEERWFELSVAAMRTPLPPDGRLIALVRDITDRKLTELALMRLNAELEQRVTDRTALAEQRAGQLRQLARRLAETAQTERRRIARILHEDLQQILVGIHYQIHLLRAHDPARVAETEAQIQQALRVSATLTAELSPAILYEEGLSAALPWLADQMRIRHGLEVHTEIRTECGHDDGVPVFLYNAARELLLNVIKHAAVKVATVVLERDPDDRLRLMVSDPGRGFDASNHDTSRYGLFEIREQVAGFGGVCTIDSRPGGGTRVTLTV